MGPRITVAVATVLRIFLDDVPEPRYGYELMRATGFASGKLYPILARLEAHGWLEARFEEVDPATAGRPARRWYRLTEEGTAAARYELAALHRQLAPASPASKASPAGSTRRSRPAGGVA
jgi:PadR family transcriptional regulator, regulatory protein PadR